jgi:hypothetical protein
MGLVRMRPKTHNDQLSVMFMVWASAPSCAEKCPHIEFHSLVHFSRPAQVSRLITEKDEKILQIE